MKRKSYMRLLQRRKGEKRYRAYAPPQKYAHPSRKGDFYRLIHRLTDAAVRDAFRCHPEYIAADIDPKAIQSSIAKRVTGAITGYAKVHRVDSGIAPTADFAPVRMGNREGSRALTDPL